MKLKTILIYLAFSLAITHVSYGQVTFGPSVPVVSALPATCTAVGSSSSSSSVQYQGTFYYCSATNTWTAYGSGGGGGTPAGSSGDYQINNGGSFGAGALAQSAGRLTATPTAQSSGVASFFRVITPADTTQTASTESIGAQFGGNTSAATVTRQWATGALTTQRENLFIAPTYAFSGASTLTSAVNLEAASPIAGTNATLTNSYAARFVASSAAHVPLVAKGAASQSGNLFEAQNSSGTAVALITAGGQIATKSNFVSELGGYFGVNSASSPGSATIALQGGGNATVGIASTFQYGWASTTNALSGAIDTGLARAAAGVIRLTNGSTGQGILALGTSTTAPTLQSGSGSPEGAITAIVGSVYLRTDGGANTTLYVKESGSGNTGWIAK